MYESKTVDVIHSLILANIDSTYEKSKGYPTYNLTRPFAVEESALYSAIDAGINLMYVKNLSGDELTTRVQEWRGITRKAANAAKVVLTVTGTGSIKIGDLFSTANNVQFKSLETKTIAGTGTITAQCTTAGAIGMVGANCIVQMPVTLAGITAVNNINASYDGYDAEDDDGLKQRYYDSLQIPPTSGNKYHYLAWAKEVVGVGDAKCFPLWNGANTVKVVIIDSNKQPANADLIARVQAYIDPLDNSGNPSGNGEGEAPIGCYCTVSSATGKAINVTVTVTLLNNYTTAEIQTTLITNLTTYLKSIAFQQDYVSYAKIGDVVLNTEGVKDYSSLQVNGATTNVNLADAEVAILGTVTVS